MKENPKELLSKLHLKFSDNFKSSISSKNINLGKSFSLMSGLVEVGQIMRNKELLKHHQRCCDIFDEIFADTVISIYLASNSLDKPAMIVLRRVFELGVAVVYLWDMPHMLYSWEKLEKDLRFSEMLNHLCSEGYKYFIKEENGYRKIKELVDVENANRIYRDLSDIVHGKISTFETGLDNKYTYNDKDWQEIINFANEISLILLSMFILRFNIKDELIKRVPSLKKHLRGLTVE